MSKIRIDVSELNTQELIDLLHECEDRLSLVSVKEYSEIIGKSKRHVFDLIHSKQLTYIVRDKLYYIVINNHL